MDNVDVADKELIDEVIVLSETAFDELNNVKSIEFSFALPCEDD